MGHFPRLWQITRGCVYIYIDVVVVIQHQCRKERPRGISASPLGSVHQQRLASGKLTVRYGKSMGKPWENGDLYGKSPFLMGKSTINDHFQW